MVSEKPPRTLVRAGIYAGELSEAVAESSVGLREVTFSLGNVVKYVAYDSGKEPHLTIVSQQIDKKLSPGGYNTQLSVTSFSDSRNEQVANRFERETGMNFVIGSPKGLVALMQNLNFMFPIFLKGPEAALALWGVKF